MNYGSPNEPGNPILERISGRYYLRVAAVEELETGYSYTVEDAQGYQYRAKKCKRMYSIGQIVLCSVHVIVINRQIQVKSISIGKQSYAIKQRHFSNQARDIIQSVGAKGKKVNHKSGSIISGSFKGNVEKPSSHGKEERFHLIYTPMGNKR